MGKGQALLVPSFIAISVMNWLGSVGQEQNRTERRIPEKESFGMSGAL